MGNNITGVILAAGLSSRMDSFKPLLPIGGKSAIELIIEAFRGAGIENLIVVTGHNREQLKEILVKKRVTEVFNSSFEDGMFSSVQAGIKGANSIKDSKPEGILLALADCPLISEGTIKVILQAHNTKAQFIIPCYQGKKGHPIFLSNDYFEEILEYKGPAGLKGFMNQHQSSIHFLETQDPLILLDMDNWAGYLEILKYYDMNNKDVGKNPKLESLKKQIGDKRLILIRHCQQEQSGEKIFLGQTDFSLSEEGRIDAVNLGADLLKHKLRTNKIYSSDLKRAKETTAIIIEQIKNSQQGLDISIIEKPEFREINLGAWDGMAISKIREKFPEEYKARGSDLLRYKCDPFCENFYDLQYRVIKELRKLLLETNEEDIVIVTHAGVIKVILSNFYGNPLENELKVKMKTGVIQVLETERINK